MPKSSPSPTTTSTSDQATPLSKEPISYQFVSEKIAAEMLALSVKTLRSWRLRGQGPNYAKLGRSVRYATCDLRAFAAQSIRKSTSG
jgi:hypothetical protein